MASTLSNLQMQKLKALLGRLVDQQKVILLQAAETSSEPPVFALSKVADLELAIAATENLLDTR
jgi:hypothetical protein